MKRNIKICRQDLPPVLKQDVEERETCGERFGWERREERGRKERKKRER